MSTGIIVGHSYYGKGKVMEVTNSLVTVDFGYPYGLRTLPAECVQVISLN